MERVIEASGPRLHCGGKLGEDVVHGSRVIEASGPRLHCGGVSPPQMPYDSSRDRGLRASTSLRHRDKVGARSRCERDRGLRASTSLRLTVHACASRCNSSDRGLRASTSLRPKRRRFETERAAVIEASGPRLHCGALQRGREALNVLGWSTPPGLDRIVATTSIRASRLNRPGVGTLDFADISSPPTHNQRYP